MTFLYPAQSFWDSKKGYILLKTYSVGMQFVKSYTVLNFKLKQNMENNQFI